MVSVFSENLRILNAANFKRNVSQQGNTKVYFTFGRVLPWNNESVPPQANSSVTTFNEVWDNMIGAKLLTGNEISHVIPRNNWSSGTVYNAYDHCECGNSLFDSNNKFFILTTDWNVYKCLSNGTIGSTSTVKPTQIFTDRAIEEADGYVWKYMYTVSDAEKLKFTTSTHIPVKTLMSDDGSLQWQVQEEAVAGTINAIRVENGGTGYVTGSNVVITITGDGMGATAVARVNTVSQTVANVAITAPGMGYTYATISITGGGGTGANLRAIISSTGGHGSDPLRELGGSTLMLNPRLQGTEENTFPAVNDLRQIALIEDPYLKGTQNVATGIAYGQFVTILLDNASDTNFAQDEFIFQGASASASTFSGRVLSLANGYVRIVNTTGTPQTDPLVGTAGSRNPNGPNSITNLPLEKYTGKLLYIDNIPPITRASDQTEDFKIILRF